jgi:DNA end-binding protein Ku
VLDLIERKASGQEIAVQPQADEPEAAPDLMAALEASLAAVKSDGAEDAPAPKERKRAASGDGSGKAAAKRPAKAKP